MLARARACARRAARRRRRPPGLHQGHRGAAAGRRAPAGALPASSAAASRSSSSRRRAAPRSSATASSTSASRRWPRASTSASATAATGRSSCCARTTSRPTVFRYYRAADVCYVSSLHDGMNLVAKEFVAARDDERGVLVLSQFTGAARELTEALIVNPYDLDAGQRRAGGRARACPPTEQRERMRVDARASSPSSTSTAGRAACSWTPRELRRRERLTGRLSPTTALARGGARMKDILLAARNRALLAAVRLVERAARLRLRRHAGADRRRPRTRRRCGRARARLFADGVRALSLRRHLRPRQGRRRRGA